jgi:hypothetical protein
MGGSNSKIHPIDFDIYPLEMYKLKTCSNNIRNEEIYSIYKNTYNNTFKNTYNNTFKNTYKNYNSIYSVPGIYDKWKEELNIEVYRISF